jgi:hypothetical protein
VKSLFCLVHRSEIDGTIYSGQRWTMVGVWGTMVGDKLASYSWSTWEKRRGQTRKRVPEGEQDVPWIPVAERLIRAKDDGLGEEENTRVPWLGSLSCSRCASGECSGKFSGRWVVVDGMGKQQGEIWNIASERRALWKALGTSTGSPESSPIHLRRSDDAGRVRCPLPCQLFFSD